MSDKFFQLIFTVKYFCLDRADYRLKTISSHVGLMQDMEKTANRFEERFANQSFKIMSVTLLSADEDFRHDWNAIHSDKDISFGVKTKTLLENRLDISEQLLFRDLGFIARRYSPRCIDATVDA
jgi:hypothetical protein